MILPGSFDLHIIDSCNLHCTGCIVLDYLESGKVTNQKYNLDDVKEVMSNFERLDLRVEELKILGGEPTLSKQLDEIIDYLIDVKIHDKLTLITNGLNFTEKVVDSLIKLDKLIISVYPIDETNLKHQIRISKLHDKLASSLELEYYYMPTFRHYGHKQKHLEYSAELNWERCFEKDDCRVITKDNLYRCTNTYSADTDKCTWEDRQKVIDFIMSDVPLSHCKDCPFPPAEKEWTSNNLPIDMKNFERGLEIIKSYGKRIPKLSEF
jgi:organic radical activating enzyme